MPTYRVILTRDITESTIVEVTVATEEQAETAARDKLLDTPDSHWEIDDGSWNQGDIYVTGVDPLG